jgi:hypothetical protein
VRRKCRTDPTARGWRVTQRPATAAGDEGRGSTARRCDRELVLDADSKGRKHRAPDKVFVVDTECEGERGHGLLYRPGSSVNGISLPEVQKWRGAIFGTVTCGLVTTCTWKRRGGVGSPFSGCVKSETGKKRPSAKIDGTRSGAPTRCNGGQKRCQKRPFLAAIVPRCSIVL